LRLSGSLHQFLCYKYVCSLRKVHTGVYWANLRERAHLEYLDVDGEDNNTEINFKQSMVGVTLVLVWLTMGGRRRVVVNAVMNFWILYNAGNFRTDC
jgi:hypothetical protein